ncbi:PH domain-containing protein [Haloarchaeobius sp. FL176]|uniref:PH domain-containing protein n=1 Tax=Haloarchaeobius sp. FL176 TaxID=2967129 RepID=UPI0021483C68|nr:PH domain-containing protein [Haloarchaeobius sp. FL176]
MTAADSPDVGGSEFDWLSLDDDEEIVWSGNPHPMSIVPALVFGIPLVILLVGIFVIVAAYLWRENTDYVVTTDGVYTKSGVFSRDVQRVDFDKVQNISFSQGVVGNYFGYGKVDISTAGGSGVEMQFQSVADPKSVQERINRLIKENRRGSDRRGEDAPAKGEVLDEILAELRTMRETFERIEAQEADAAGEAHHGGQPQEDAPRRTSSEQASDERTDPHGQ